MADMARGRVAQAVLQYSESSMIGFGPCIVHYDTAALPLPLQHESSINLLEGHFTRA